MLVGLALAALCSWGGDGKRDAEVKATFAALAEQARDPKPDKRRSAVRGLAQIGSREAWAIVVEALADPESAVGDAAQMCLGRLEDPKVASELLGSRGLGAKEDRVAERVAEAFGRIRAPVDGEMLARELTSRDAERTRLVIWSIERLAESKRLVGDARDIGDELARIESSRADPGMSGAALLALAEVDPDRGRKLALAALKDRAPERRCAAGLALAKLRGPELYGAAMALTKDSDSRVRMRGVDCLGDVGSKVALLGLVGALGDETRMRVRWRIVELLQDASGLKHRADPRPWKLWAEQLPDGPAPRARPKPPPTDPQATVAGGLIGLQVVSDRVAFLFDFSGSMWTPIADGRMPKDIVSSKLREALTALPETTEFNLIPYANEPIPWESEVQPAKKPQKERALEFFDACRARGRGNVYDAVLLAMADPKVDTVVLLTDGVPTGGLHSDMDLITPLLLERTRFRPLVVDSILVDAPPAAVHRFEELSRLTGGRSIEVELVKAK
jgi:HEAT repeat protein